MPDVRALEVCVQYDHWAREIARLTREIRDVECPRETDAGDVLAGEAEDVRYSHFREACGERVVVYAGYEIDDVRPLRLEEVAERVRDCDECSRLARLVYERKVARRQWAATKRQIRAVAKRATREVTHA